MFRNVSIARHRIRAVALALGITSVLSTVVGAPAAVATTSADPVADAVSRWNETAGRAAIASCIAPLDNPLHESRMYAMTHLAIHDALNAIDRRSTPYALDFRARRGATPAAAVASAARDVLTSTIREIPEPFPPECIRAGLAVVDREWANVMSTIPDGAATRAGIEAGSRAAAAVVAARVGDGSDTALIVPDFPQGTKPGEWRFTPGTPFAFAPGWGEVTPFSLRSSGQFRLAPPAALSSGRYAKDLQELKAFGGDGITTPTRRSAAQTETALFWWGSSPLMWNRIGRSLAQTRNLDAWKEARLFALLNMALADGYVASFDAKYDYRYWRPVTAIREAEADGNPATSADPTWTPLRTTPAIPDHDSAHAIEGGAAAGVFTAFFGTNRFAFSACSDTLPDQGCGSGSPVLHRFSTFSAAAAENAVSRVYIGFHFRKATEAGLANGYAIGLWTAGRHLRPVR